MAFVARQNQITFDGSDTDATYNLRVLRLVIKTILDAAEAEKTVNSRATAYWYLDPNRINGGTEPSAVGASDTAIYDLSTTANMMAYGVFFKNGAGETAFIFFDGTTSYNINGTKSSTGISFCPVIGASSYSENAQIVRYASSGKNTYGLGMCISKYDFGGLSTPWASGFFYDSDIKPLGDTTSYESSQYYANGKTADLIVGIDGKKILIDRRMSQNSYNDQLSIYGDIISTIDIEDVQTDCLLVLMQGSSDTAHTYMAMFRDKNGSMSYQPNGTNQNNMRRPVCLANTVMICGSNTFHIPYTGISLGWESITPARVNSALNAAGNGYKGITDPSIVRLLTADSIIQNKTVYDDNGVNMFVIAKYTDSEHAWCIAVPWDSNNPVIN